MQLAMTLPFLTNSARYAAVSPQPPFQNPGQGLRHHLIALGRSFWDVAFIQDLREAQLMCINMFFASEILKRTCTLIVRQTVPLLCHGFTCLLGPSCSGVPVPVLMRRYLIALPFHPQPMGYSWYFDSPIILEIRINSFLATSIVFHFWGFSYLFFRAWCEMCALFRVYTTSVRWHQGISHGYSD